MMTNFEHNLDAFEWTEISDCTDAPEDTHV